VREVRKPAIPPSVDRGVGEDLVTRCALGFSRGGGIDELQRLLPRSARGRYHAVKRRGLARLPRDTGLGWAALYHARPGRSQVEAAGGADCGCRPRSASEGPVPDGGRIGAAPG